MENIWMMFLGMVIWQAVIFLLIIFGNEDSDIQQICYCGIWGLLFLIVVKPIAYFIYKIRIAIFNKKYVCLSFWRLYNNNSLEHWITFWAKQDIVEKLYITNDPQKENRDSVQIVDMKINRNLPHKDQILTFDRLENGDARVPANIFHKFLK